MNLPNALTISRFLLIPVFVLLFFQDNLIAAFLIFLLAGVTDVVDGFLARKYHLVTELGSMLDPLADKLMTLTVIISLLAAGYIPWLVAIVVFIRDAGMIISSVFFHFKGKKTVPANILGKITTVLFYLAILLIVLQVPYNIFFLWLVALFAFFTSFIYLFEFRKVNNLKKKNKNASKKYREGATAD